MHGHGHVDSGHCERMSPSLLTGASFSKFTMYLSFSSFSRTPLLAWIITTSPIEDECMVLPCTSNTSSLPYF